MDRSAGKALQHRPRNRCTGGSSTEPACRIPACSALRLHLLTRDASRSLHLEENFHRFALAEALKGLPGLNLTEQAAHHGFCQDLPVLDPANGLKELARKHGDVSGQCHAASPAGQRAEGRVGIEAKQDNAPRATARLTARGNHLSTHQDSTVHVECNTRNPV